MIEENQANRVKVGVLRHVLKLWKENKHRMLKRVMDYQTRAEKIMIIMRLCQRRFRDACSFLVVQRRKGQVSYYLSSFSLGFSFLLFLYIKPLLSNLLT